jgi:hypothetical protein
LTMPITEGRANASASGVRSCIATEVSQRKTRHVVRLR